MKYRFHLEKKHFDIEVAGNATLHSPTTIKVNKHLFTIFIGEYTDIEVKSVFFDNKLYQIEVVKDEAGYPQGIFVNGEYYSGSLLKIDKLFYFKEKPISSVKSGIVRSFIPGYIKRVYFAENDRIKENDIVLIHEAMKMENEIRSPKSGIIKKIGVKEGDNVLANHILFEIE